MENHPYHTRMQRKLTAAFSPMVLEIHDDSASHAGHAGHKAEGETHFSIAIVSAAFSGLNRVARHRAIYDALAEELSERVHALSLSCLTPNEYTNR